MSSVTLRRVSTADAELIHRIRCEPSASRYQPTLPLSLEEVRSMLAERAWPAIAPESAGKLQWVVESDGVPAGWISLEISEAARRHGNGVIGYTIAEAFHGRGIGKAALAALLPIAFGRSELNLERLEAIASVENIASQRVLEANGFHREGTLRGLLVIHGVRVDHAIYGLLRTDWESS